MTAQPFEQPDESTTDLRAFLTEAVRAIRAGDGADPDVLDEMTELGVVLPADVHPLDDPSFDLDALLAWFVKLPTDQPCALGHWVTTEIGRRRIGTVHLDLTTAPAAVEAADPHVFVRWARCQACGWPVWALTHTDPPTEVVGLAAVASGRPRDRRRRLGFYEACGAAISTDSDWRLLTPARACAVGAPWPLPLTDRHPHPAAAE